MVDKGRKQGMVRIEPQHPDHAEGLFAALCDPRIYAFLDDAPPQSIEAVRQRIHRLIAGPPPERLETWLNWSVFLDETIVGYTQATLHNQTSATLAYVFSPIVWGNGTAEQAVDLTIATLAGQHGVIKLTADTDVRNLPSQGLLGRLRFVQTHQHGCDIFYERQL